MMLAPLKSDGGTNFFMLLVMVYQYQYYIARFPSGMWLYISWLEIPGGVLPPLEPRNPSLYLLQVNLSKKRVSSGEGVNLKN